MAPREQLHEMLTNVSDERSLLTFIAALISERKRAAETEKKESSSPYGPDAGGWENTSIEGYLEAAAAWAEASNFGLEQGLPANNSWRRFAAFLLAGRIYE
jgi:hypothetical protein